MQSPKSDTDDICIATSALCIIQGRGPVPSSHRQDLCQLHRIWEWAVLGVLSLGQSFLLTPKHSESDLCPAIWARVCSLVYL